MNTNGKGKRFPRAALAIVLRYHFGEFVAHGSAVVSAGRKHGDL